MSPRPNPTQTKGTDEREARRLYQAWLRPPYAIDAHEQARQLDEGSGDNGARLARRAALDEWATTHGPRYVLSPAQLEDLERFLDDKGPRPGFAWPAVAGQHMTTEESAAHALAAAERNAQGPKELPGQPGRYVEPSGRFARSDDPSFTPDPR